MRYTIALAAFAAIGVQAIPHESHSHSVQPISQISDGQIQAPPATSLPSYGASSAPVASPSVTGGPASTPAKSTGVYSTSAPPAVPSVVVPPAGNTTIPIVPGVSTSGAPSYPNSTVPTGVRPSTSLGGSGTPTPSRPAQQTGAASVNMISFGGLALAVAGFVFA
ncbi:hypothetical protein B0J11DRAFT_530624 [Dendryphion nanum]|uniref:Uncharacterized protein n=1 Tax=Dendryphion nanum TaxID=256645 RepID=A0A9P9DT36_9PLEO|nr:hypothetical protein B0J11DRAFT_530624 [Dendryphion nanum]